MMNSEFVVLSSNNKNSDTLGFTPLGLFVLGIISHRIFCVRTTIDKLLFD